MNERKRLNLAFSMDFPPHREAWDILCAIPFGQRTDEICRLLREKNQQQNLLDAIRAIIREEMQSASLQVQTNTNLPEPAGNDAINDEVLGFLLSLQEEGEDTT